MERKGGSKIIYIIKQLKEQMEIKGGSKIIYIIFKYYIWFQKQQKNDINGH